jgi:hypothetical protein
MRDGIANEICAEGGARLPASRSQTMFQFSKFKPFVNGISKRWNITD